MVLAFLIFLLFFAASVIGQLGVGIAALKHEGNLENGIKTKMNETMFQYNVTSKFWDFVQQNYQCCGVLEYKVNAIIEIEASIIFDFRAYENSNFIIDLLLI